ncbi:LruC domain-containing protein [bacterium]|nr:LruC domain-containing protein [bacterium]
MRITMDSLRVIAPALFLATLLASCGGGGSSATPDTVGQGNGNIPGQQGNMDGGASGNPIGGGGGGGGFTSQVVIGTGVKTDRDVLPKAEDPGDIDEIYAPLGTNPEYNMQVVLPETVSVDESKSSSLVVGGGDDSRLEIIDLVMMPNDVAPNWSLTSASFHEGQQIDLYIKYFADAGVTVNTRHWSAPDINVDLNQSNIAHNTSAEYVVKLDSYAPFGKVGTNYIFKYTLSRTYNDAPQTLTSVNFPYNITAAEPGTYSTRYPLTGDAQIAYEDLLVNSDYDYNDFVCHVNMTEWRMEGTNDLGQITMKVKAKARVAGYSSEYQFNISSAFPGATVHATIKQFYANGTPHGSPVSWQSSQGADLPIFTPTRQALPSASGSYQANGIAGTQFIDGDYAEVTIIFDEPVPYGTWDPMPYNPLLRVTASQNNIYKIGLWQKKGDTVDSEGHQLVDSQGRPLAFIVPSTYAWPLEGKPAWECFSGYTTWANWIKNPDINAPEPSPKWWTQTPSNMSKVFTRDKFTPYP